MPYLSDYAYHVLFCCCCCHSALYKYRVRLPWSLCPKWWFLSEESQSTQQSRSIQRSDHPSVDLQSLPLPALCDEKVRIDGWMWSHTCFTCTRIKTRSDHARKKRGFSTVKDCKTRHPASRLATSEVDVSVKNVTTWWHHTSPKPTLTQNSWHWKTAI